MERIKQLLSGINPNYIIDDNGFCFYENKKVAVAFFTKEESNSTVQPNRKHFSQLRDLYRAKGIRLIQIFDWQYERMYDKIHSLLTIAVGNPKRVYARQCEIKRIDNPEAKELNNRIHLQGHRNAHVTYGLFYNGELVQLMSFSKMKYNRNLKGNNEWEIIRGCPGSNNIVVGGCSKCFKHFIQDFNPDCIFSYCDTALFNGASYLAIGMKYAGNTGETKYWVLDEIDPFTGKQGYVIPRCPSKYRELLERSKGVTIWTPGSDRFVWTKEGYEYQGKGKEYL